MSILIGRLDSPRREEVAAITDLASVLEAQLVEGRREFPGITLDDAAYLRHLADKLKERASGSGAKRKRWRGCRIRTSCRSTT